MLILTRKPGTSLQIGEATIYFHPRNQVRIDAPQSVAITRTELLRTNKPRQARFVESSTGIHCPSCGGLMTPERRRGNLCDRCEYHPETMFD